MRLRRPAILFAAALLLASACGSTDNEGSGSTTKPAGSGSTTKPAGSGSTTKPARSSTTAAAAARKAADAAEVAASALYAAWKTDDTEAAAKVADKAAIDVLFAEAYSGTDQKFYGCGQAKAAIACVYFGKGKSATKYLVKGSAETGYRVATVEIVPE